MKSTMLFVLTLALLWTVNRVSATGVLTNLEANLGFEAVDNGSPKAWSGGEFGKLRANVFVDENEKHGGQRSVRFACSNKFTTLLSDKIQVKPNTIYRISRWCKNTNSASLLSTYPVIINKNGKQVRLQNDAMDRTDIHDTTIWQTVPLTTMNAGWIKHAGWYKTGAHEERIRLLLVGHNKRSTTATNYLVCWFDDIEIAELRQVERLPFSACPLIHGQWEFVSSISDEFDGNAVDTNKWKVRKGGLNSYYVNRPENVSVADGKLRLTITSSNTPPAKHKYNTAFVKSQDHMRYGYIEVRTRLTRAAHVDNTFWLVGTDNDGFGYFEIDVYECFSRDPPNGIGPKKNRIGGGLFTRTIVDSPGTRNRYLGNYTVAGLDLAEDFFVYGFELDADHLIVYFEGKPVLTHENTQYFYPLQITFNLATGGWCGGFPMDSDLPATYEIDYVRVWQRTDLADPRIASFKFALPDRAATYQLPTEDGGRLHVYRISHITVDYRNPGYFNAQKAEKIGKQVMLKDADGKIVAFNFEWTSDGTDTEHNGYRAWRVAIEPVEKKPKGSTETFKFRAENGKDVTLKVTY